jgi:hypothetical protein
MERPLRAQARGSAPAISPDARCGILPALARGKPRFAILATLGFPRRLDRHGPNPSQSVGALGEVLIFAGFETS